MAVGASPNRRDASSSIASPLLRLAAVHGFNSWIAAVIDRPNPPCGRGGRVSMSSLDASHSSPPSDACGSVPASTVPLADGQAGSPSPGVLVLSFRYESHTQWFQTVQVSRSWNGMPKIRCGDVVYSSPGIKILSPHTILHTSTILLILVCCDASRSGSNPGQQSLVLGFSRSLHLTVTSAVRRIVSRTTAGIDPTGHFIPKARDCFGSILPWPGGMKRYPAE